MMLLALVLSSVLQADDPARRSVERSLAFLEKEGTAWIRERACLSCHHVPFLLWSHREAQNRGIAIDAKKLAEWTEWSRKESLDQRVRIKLTDEGLESLHGGGMAPETVARLTPLAKQPGFTEGALAKLLSPAELTRHREDLEKRTVREKGDGGGLDTMSFLLLAGVTGEGDREFLSATRARMIELQQPDGSWKPGGQLFGLKRPAAEATDVTTMWTMIALEEGLPKALARVKKAAPGKTNEWLAVRMILERKFGEADGFHGYARELLSRQNGDGGWAWLHGGASDAFATGLALYALHFVGSIDAAAAEKARTFLTRTQGEDGSWAVDGLSTKPRPGKEPIYRYWGTAWAAIGLARTLPGKP